MIEVKFLGVQGTVKVDDVSDVTGFNIGWYPHRKRAKGNSDTQRLLVSYCLNHPQSHGALGCPPRGKERHHEDDGQSGQHHGQRKLETKAETRDDPGGSPHQKVCIEQTSNNARSETY